MRWICYGDSAAAGIDVAVEVLLLFFFLFFFFCIRRLARIEFVSFVSSAFCKAHRGKENRTTGAGI